MSDEGFWVQYWMIRGQSDKPTKVTYQFFKYSGGYTDEDKNNDELWRKEAESWAQNEGRGWSSSRYQYGFVLVNSPPIKWLESKVSYYKKSLEFFEARLNEVTK